MSIIPKNFFRNTFKVTAGCTPEMFTTYEAQIGFTLPAAMKELYTRQNGGGTHYDHLADVSPDEFTLYGGFSEINPNGPYPLKTFQEIILCTCTEEDIASVKKDKTHFYPERLILFAPLDGHSYGCLDYGYLLPESVTEPRVVFINEDSDDFLHFGEFGPSYDSFAEFLANLRLGGDTLEHWYLGITTESSYPGIAALLQKELGCTLEEQTDDRNGWYDFALWHSGNIPIPVGSESLKKYAAENGTTLTELEESGFIVGQSRSVHSILTPNQHRTGTYQFPDSANCTLILDVFNSWFTGKDSIQLLVENLKTIPSITNVEFVFDKENFT
jgi:SMI1 / KNR4 family (SUKH-1)